MRRILLCLVVIITLSACTATDAERQCRSLDISLSLEGDKSRVELSDDCYIWSGDEQLGLYINSATPSENILSAVTLRDGVGYCSADVAEYVAGNNLYGYMPYSEQSGDIHSVQLTIPTTQSVESAGDFPGDAMPMVSDPYTLTDGAEAALKFYPMGGFLCYNIYASSDYASERVVSVRYATSYPIAGQSSYDLTSQSLKLAPMDCYSVTTTLTNSYSVAQSLLQCQPIYMVVAPGDHSGTLTITTDAAIYTYNYSRIVARNHYYSVNIDLSRAENRKSLTGGEPFTASLTYEECSSAFSSYGSPKQYTNDSGTWTICAHNETTYKAMQLNKNKVAYIGTPTFENSVSSITMTLSTAYSDAIYICTESGESSASGIVSTTQMDGDYEVTIDLSSLNLNHLYIRSNGCLRISSITITGVGSGGTVLPDPEQKPLPEPEPEPEVPSDAKSLPYTESFATNQGEFTINDVELGSLDYVWHHSSHDGRYYMAASAYKDAAVAAESWLISPDISLVGAEEPKLSFDHTHKYCDTPSEELTLWISVDNEKSWQQLTIPNYAANTNWTFVNSGTIELSEYIGSVVKIAFKYTSTNSTAGSWEIMNFSVTDSGATVDPTPTPTPTPDPTPSDARYSWAELPVIADADKDGVHDTDSNIYYAHHLCAGGEKNAQRTGSARNYTVCYSGRHHCPLWVAAPRHKSYESGASRTDAYGRDPKIPSDVQYSSKSTGGGCNKGHMLGSAERLSSTATNKQVFYYTNIAPQYSDSFNTGGGAWNNLEDYIDGLVCSDTLYVVIGCYFDSFSKNGASASPKTISFGGRDDVSCPTMFYYALLRTKGGSTGKRVQECSADELQCAAFTICHNMAKGHKPEAADMMSITELENLTGVKYFQNVPQAPKGSYMVSDWL